MLTTCLGWTARLLGKEALYSTAQKADITPKQTGGWRAKKYAILFEKQTKLKDESWAHHTDLEGLAVGKKSTSNETTSTFKLTH